MNRQIALACLCLAMACGVEMTETDVISPPDKIPYICNQLACGNSNSPNIAGVDFYDLNMASTRQNPIANPNHPFALTDFVRAGMHYNLHVSHGKLSGTGFLTSISGANLVGAI